MSSYFECSGNGPIVTTKAGKIRGYLWNTTYTFQGIKYANAKRFQMPEEIQPWDGIKDATSYGYVCPLLTQDVPNGEIMVPHRYWPMDEHCQYLDADVGYFGKKTGYGMASWRWILRRIFYRTDSI